MNNIVLFIDGENFLHKVKEVLIAKGIDVKKIDLSKLDFNVLLSKPLENYKVSRKVFYAAKLHFHEETKDVSKKLILFQRYLKTNLAKSGFEFLIAGNVRGQKVQVDHKTKMIFKEKGVDVKIAVDLVSLACDGKLKTAIVCSSDSDLQPAVQEARNRNVEVVYLGFEHQPNKGLTYTTHRTILFRDSEVLEACGIKV